jgi:phosphate starvation-inducible membrane PsiE
MLKAVRTLNTATANAHTAMKELADTAGTFLVDAFHLLALFAIGGTTVWSAAATFASMVTQGRARLEDISRPHICRFVT